MGIDRVENGSFIFYWTEKSVYIKVNNEIGQSFCVQGRGGTALTKTQHQYLVRFFCSGKVSCMDDLIVKVIPRYQLIATSRVLK